MKTFAKYGMMSCIVAVAAALGGWNDAWYLLTGLVSVSLPLLILAIWACKRQSTGEPGTGAGFDDEAALQVGTSLEVGTAHDNNPAASRESLLVGGLLGVPLGIALSLYLMIVFALLQRIPWIYDRYYDADHVSLEAKLSTLEQAGNYGEAVAAIEDRLTRKTGRTWQRALSERLYGDLVHQVSRLPAEEGLPLLSRAREIATQFDFDDTAARTLQGKAVGETNLASRIEELRHQQNWTGIVDVLKAELLRDDNSTGTARTLYEALCITASHCESAERQGEFYSQAVELAGRYELPSDHAQAALTQLQLAKATETRQQQQLAKLSRESAATQKQLLEELMRRTVEHSSPQAQLVTLRRIATTASQCGVELPSINSQMTELEATISKQRQVFERVEHLRRDEKQEEAIDLLASAVRTIDRCQWTMSLDAELLDCLDEWCNDATAGAVNAEAQRERLRRAITIATDCGVEAPALKCRLAAAEGELAQYHRVRAKIAELTRDRRYSDLVTYVKLQMEERPESEWCLPYAQELYSALMSAAFGSSDLRERAVLLRDAVTVVAKHNVPDASKANEHLAETERGMQEEADAERLRTTPIELPQGTRAGICKALTEAMPFVIVDVWVEAPDGVSLTGLQQKDFSVTCLGRQIPFVMQPVAVDSVPTQFAILADISGSVAPALPAVKSGINVVAERLAEAKASMKLIPFNAKVAMEIPWSDDAAAISSAARGLNCEGGTALYRALLEATEELARQPIPGERCILLFTDGADTAGGVSLNDVLLQCRAKGITVSAVALRTEELKPEVLQRITAESGGQYLEAANVSELATRFVQASRAMRRQRYRLVLDITNHEISSRDVCSISIGRGSPVLVEWRGR